MPPLDEPRIGTTRPRSFAAVSSSRARKGVLTFHCRKNTERDWRIIELRTVDSARELVERQLDEVSSSPGRTILLNDEIYVDMPAVTLDDLERIFREETILGRGTKAQIFVVVYDQDPTMTPTSEEGASSSDGEGREEGSRARRRRRKGSVGYGRCQIL